MSETDELVERLRGLHPQDSGYAEIGRESAAEITRLQAERERLVGLVENFWRNALVIESSVRSAEGCDSPAHKDVLKAIIETQDFYKSCAALATEAGVGGPPRKPVCPDCMGMGRRGVLACNACGATGQVG